MNETRSTRAARRVSPRVLRWMVASALVVSTAAWLAPRAHASQPVLGAIVGGGAGAMIGQSIGGRDGAVIGSAIGAAAGVAAAQQVRHGGYGASVSFGVATYPPPIYVPSPPVYYAPPPVLYAPPAVVYRAPRVVYSVPPRVVYRPAHGLSHRHGHHRGDHRGRGHRH